MTGAELRTKYRWTVFRRDDALTQHAALAPPSIDRSGSGYYPDHFFCSPENKLLLLPPNERIEGQMMAAALLLGRVPLRITLVSTKPQREREREREN